MNELRMNGFESLTMDEMMAVDGGGKALDTVGLGATLGGGAYGLATAATPAAAAVAVAGIAVGAYIYACYYAEQRTPANYSITRRK